MYKIILLIFLFSTQIFAQWQSDVRLTNDPGSSMFFLGKTIASSGDTVHVTWTDTRDGNFEIYYKRSIDGGLTWGPDTRLTNNTGNSIHATISNFGSTVHIVWYDNRDGNDEIYYKKSTDGGNIWGADTRLTNNSSTSDLPTISATNSTINVVWRDNRDGNYEIYYKKSTDGGNIWGADTRLTNNSSNSYYPVVEANNSTIHVVWEDNRDGNYEIYYKNSLDNGITWGTDIRLTNAPDGSNIPSLSLFGSTIFVTWMDNRDANWEIYAKRSIDGGINWGTDIRLTNNTSLSQYPSIAISCSNVHVVWNDERDGNSEIYYKYSSDGGLNWGSDTRLTNASGSSRIASVSVAGSIIHTTWQDDRDGNIEIYYKRNPTGNPIPPTPPLLYSPVYNSTNQPLTLNLLWYKSQNALSYRVQLATDPGFSNIIVNDSTITDSVKTITGLNYLTTYYWRVNAKNAAGTSGYSSVWQFTTIQPVPLAPVLFSPVNNSTNQPVTLNLIWYKSQFASIYRIQVASDSSFNNLIVNDSTVTDSVKIVSGLNNNTDYWWRVQAKNTSGISSFSTPFKFSTIVPFPNAPNLISPLNNSLGNQLNLTLIWSKPQYSSVFRVIVATDNSFNNIIVNDSSLTDTMKIITGLNPLTYYWWKVQAKNIAGWGNYSSAFNFKTLGTPGQLSLIQPTNNSINQPVNQIFKWTKGIDQTDFISNIQLKKHNKFLSSKRNEKIDRIGDNTEIVNKYWFEIVTDTISMSNLLKDTLLTDTTKNINGLNNLTNYWWRVKAKNEIGWGSFSTWFKFTTIILNPTVPLLFNPQNNSINIPTTLSLNWFKLPTATGYTFQLAKDSIFTQIVINDSTLADSIKTVSGLDTLTKYYWRVNGRNAGGVSQWSEIWHYITIPYPPIAPNLISPLNNSVVNILTPIMNWDSIATASLYRLMVSTDSTFTNTVFDTSSIVNSHFMIPAGKLINNNLYYWRVRAINSGGQSVWSSNWRFSVNVVGINTVSSVVSKEYKLYNNYPNPFNPTTKIKFDIPKNTLVKLTIYDIAGKEIVKLVNSQLIIGRYEYQWDARGLSSGVYFYRLEAGKFTDIKRMILIK